MARALSSPPTSSKRYDRTNRASTMRSCSSISELRHARTIVSREFTEATCGGNRSFTAMGQAWGVLVSVGCRFEYETLERTPSLWQIRPRSDAGYRLTKEAWETPAPSRAFVDAYGNLCDRVTLPAGMPVVRYDAVVSTGSQIDESITATAPTEVEDLPDEAFVYLLPSRFCWPDMLHDAAWDLFGSIAPGATRVTAVRDWSTRISAMKRERAPPAPAPTTCGSRGPASAVTSPTWALLFARALNVPSRYVAGYLPDGPSSPPGVPMDFASWLEVWLEGRWWTVDPRNGGPQRGRVAIARGRDALDAAMVTTWGGAQLVSMEVWALEVGVPSLEPRFD